MSETITLRCPNCNNDKWLHKGPNDNSQTFKCAACGTQIEVNFATESNSEPAKAKRAKPTRTVVNALMKIDNDTRKVMGLPHGNSTNKEQRNAWFTTWITEAIRQAETMFEPKDITKKVLDALEDENYHEMVAVAMYIKRDRYQSVKDITKAFNE